MFLKDIKNLNESYLDDLADAKDYYEEVKHKLSPKYKTKYNQKLQQVKDAINDEDHSEKDVNKLIVELKRTIGW